MQYETEHGFLKICYFLAEHWLIYCIEHSGEDFYERQFINLSNISVKSILRFTYTYYYYYFSPVVELVIIVMKSKQTQEEKILVKKVEEYTVFLNSVQISHLYNVCELLIKFIYICQKIF